MDLVYRFRVATPARRTLPSPVYRSHLRTETGDSRLTVHRLPDAEVVRFPGVAEFHLADDRIVAWAETEQRRAAAEICLLGPVLAIWLELRGVVALHASAVVVDGRGVGFLSESGGGKSSLAAEFVGAGRPLLCDDIVALEASENEWMAHPGLAQMRLWPPTARRLDDGWESWPRVHPRHAKRCVTVGAGGVGEWCSRAVPLVLLCLPAPVDDETLGVEECRMTKLPGPDRLIELIRHSFAARAVEALGLQAERLERLSALAGAVPLVRLTFRRGLERLPGVRHQIERRLAGHDVD